MAQTARISPPRRNLRVLLTLGIALATLLAFSRAPQTPRGEGPTGESAFSVSVGGDRTPVTGAPIDLVVTHRDRNGEPTADFDWFGGGVTIRGLRDLEGRSLEAPVAIEADPGGRRTTTMQVDAEGRLEVKSALLDGPLEFALADRRPGGIPSPVPGWMALAPAVLAILLAILFRQVYIALFAGIWIGGWAIADGAWAGFKLAVTDIIPGALAQRDKISIIVFSTLLGGVVAMVARMGGTRALVEMVASRGESRRGAMFSTWIAGVMIFFDDYANALLVGNTMRPVTDRFRVSREKLAFLVDSTSAPVACIFIISTWIATEINYIQDRLSSEVVQNATGFAADGGYDVFLQTIPFNFYPIFCLFFGLMICLTGRDYGPMLRAERRAAVEGKLVRDGAVPLSSKEMDELEPVDATRTYWWNAALPVLTIVASVLGFLWATGGASIAADADVVRHEIRVVERGLADAKVAATPDAAAIDALTADLTAKQATLRELDDPGLRDVFGASDSYYALLMAAFLGVIVALVLAVGQRLMRLGEAIETVTAGMKAMIPAVLVLSFAWSLQSVCERMGTSQFLVQHVSFNVFLLPTVIFILSAFVGFATGTSWGTMGILVPLTIDYAIGLAAEQHFDQVESAHLMVASIGAVLAGAVFGDHCSPISDTTIMSSMASGSDHVDHVKTQMPYAITVAGIAILFGYLPAGLRVVDGLPSWIRALAEPLYLLPLGATACFLAVRFVGRRI